MVETRRTSRRLQAKAAAAATSSSPSSSLSSVNYQSIRDSVCIVCCPSSPQKKIQEQEEEKKTEEEEEEEKKTEETMKEKKNEKKTEKKKQNVVVESDTESEEGLPQDVQAATAATDEDEDVDQYVSLAASGLNLSTMANEPSSSSSASLTSASICKSSTAALLKRRLVPNHLDSGASQYQEFFNFDDSKRSMAAALRADARTTEEAKVIAASQKAAAHSERQRAESQHKKSAGRRWFNFESEVMTADARRDFALLRMRNYLDPKKFYKSSDHSRALPKHFQMGVVIEGAHEYHSARLTKKQRRKTFTDEIMADETVVQYTHRVAGNIQAARSNQSRKKIRRRN